MKRMRIKVDKIEKINSQRMDLYINNKKIHLKFNGLKYNIWVSKNCIDLENTFIIRPIEGYEDEFELLEVIREPDGYLRVNLGTSENPIFEYVHRIVVFTYGDKNGNSKLKNLEVDHIDGDKERNIPENLEIVSPIVNKFRAYKNHYTGSKERFQEALFDGTPDDFIKNIKQILNI